MKIRGILFFLISLPLIATAQNVGINTTGAVADASAILDVSSTNSGILIPRMTTAQRDAIGSPATGLMVFNTTTGSFDFYNGSSWGSLSTSAAPAVYYSNSTAGCSVATPSYATVISQAFTTTSASSTVVIDLSTIYAENACAGSLNFGGAIVLDGVQVVTANFISTAGSNYDTESLPLKYSATVGAGAHTVDIRIWKMNATDCNLIARGPACLVKTVYE